MGVERTRAKTVPMHELRSRSAPVIAGSPLPMVEVEGRDHRVCYVNSAFCRLVQRKREDLVGKLFPEIVSNAAKCVRLMDRVYETGEFETQAEPDESESAYWLYAMWPAPDADNRPVRVVIQLTKSVRFQENAAAMNEALLISGLREHELREESEKANVRLQFEITERDRAEQALQQAQAKLRAHADTLEQTVAERTTQLRASIGELEAFSYSVAHDLRAPIRAIHGFTQLALEMSREEVGPSAAELLQRVVKAAIRMDSLIQDVLSLSQVIRRPMTIESVDVETLVRTLVEERPELSPPRAEIKIESPLLPMLGHAVTLSQCLTNLLGNAVKFVELGVVPRVRVWSEELAAPAIGGIQASGLAPPLASMPETRPRVRLWVEDHGIGIAPEAHKTIFEIFQRLHHSTQYEGSGIGLAIVRKAIERMGGRVGVESERGKGSRFWLELPSG